MTNREMIPHIRDVVLNACLAYELHQGKGEQWRLVFKQAIGRLKTKAGRQYRFLTLMSTQDKKQMDKVVNTLIMAG